MRSFQLEGVPRRVTKKGKERNVYDRRELLKYSSELKDLVTRLYPESPGGLLEQILPKETSGLGKIGGTPSWQQDPEFPRCEICGKYMVLIMELSEEAIAEKGDWVHYFFGCRTHPDSTASGCQGS